MTRAHPIIVNWTMNHGIIHISPERYFSGYIVSYLTYPVSTVDRATEMVAS